MLRSKVIAAFIFAIPMICVAKDDFLADRHMKQSALTCQSCHSEKPAKDPVEKDTCLKCHISYEDLAKKTSELTPNPHENHMTGGDCSDCHHAHRPPAMMCDSCHQFDLQIK